MTAKLVSLHECVQVFTSGQVRRMLFCDHACHNKSGQKMKAQVIEDICATIIKELKAQHLSNGNWDYLEPHGFEIMEKIENPQIRNLHIME